jgi:hypothetical protein
MHRCVAVLCWGLALVACSASPERADFVDSFALTNPDASRTQSECVIDALIDRYTLGGLERELEARPMAAAFEVEQFRAEFGCGLTDGVRSQLEVQLADSGISPDGAACAADDLTSALDPEDLDVLLEGEITDAFYDKYFVALEACDALP